MTLGSRIVLAVASGGALALSFPTPGFHWIAWMAMAPLLLAVVGVSPAQALLLGVLSGGLYFGGTLYWITGVMIRYGGLSPVVAVLVNLALVAYLALFPGAFAFCLALLLRTTGSAALLAAPVLWVATELGRTELFGGFPWTQLGYSQASVLPIAQAASVGGVYLVSFLVAFASAGLAYVAVPGLPRRALVSSVIVALIAGVALWGRARIAEATLGQAGTLIRVGLVQGNVAQGEKWDRARAATIFKRHLDLSEQAVKAGARLVIWPESATPFMFEEDTAGAAVVRRFAIDSGVTLLFGSDQLEVGQPPRYYNSAFLVDPTGATRAVYRKIRLVPFGEYVPLKTVFSFAGPLVEAVSDFSPGDGPIMLPVDGHPVSAAICYEVIYPDLIRSFVLSGSELLTTITNDAWFGRSSAPYQHFAMASMRAVEQGRYLVRSANTGISGIVDPYGRVVRESTLFEATVLVDEVRLLTSLTVYGRTGDLFAYTCVILTVGALVVTRRGGTRGTRTR